MRPSRPGSAPTAFGVALGLATGTLLAVAFLGAGTVLGVALALAAGSVTELTLRGLGVTTGGRARVGVVAPPLAGVALGELLVVPVDTVVIAAFVTGSLLALTVGLHWRRTSVGLSLIGSGLAVTGLVMTAGAWSVDEPAPPDPRTVAGNGIDVAVDTHAFLIQQGAVILRNDGLMDLADFLDSSDRTAPYRRTAADALLPTRESYLWRMQTGARDADRSLKQKYMPDHFFNWWTHSGKGVIAGPSGATWAEQQFAQAVTAWNSGDRAVAMYHLGAATHLVDDACAPPHASQYVPDHRAYEEWVVAHQSRYAVTRGGIYRAMFRVHTGHGGQEWSSSHTRGWVDECAHRAAELVINTAQPPPDHAGDPTSYTNTMAHFEDTQRLTAGYLAFFFETVGGP